MSTPVATDYTGPTYRSSYTASGVLRVANIYYYDIDTPLKRYVLSRPALVRHCEAIHARIESTPGSAQKSSGTTTKPS
ncbi:hypothetical protein [Paraburkholderia bryophila]|uniref:hypothetical protein n=1 Tax=Paraburkholderia bryophila TaxID=420952 RepID=UPI0011BEDE8F|nr:hypothetical protein [Paraburkholderia bryophila]